MVGSYYFVDEKTKNASMTSSYNNAPDADGLH